MAKLPNVERSAGGMLVVAGNVHTQLEETKFGLPLGANIARARPAVRSIWIDYPVWRGGYNNFGDKELPDRRDKLTEVRLAVHYGHELGLQLPAATPALVPANEDQDQSKWSSAKR
jgi:hypothetical protein